MKRIMCGICCTDITENLKPDDSFKPYCKCGYPIDLSFKFFAARIPFNDIPILINTFESYKEIQKVFRRRLRYEDKYFLIPLSFGNVKDKGEFYTILMLLGDAGVFGPQRF